MRSIDKIKRQVRELEALSKEDSCACILHFRRGNNPPIDLDGLTCPLCGRILADSHTLVEEIIVGTRQEAETILAQLADTVPPAQCGA